MGKIKVGDYVRTKEFGINRVKCFDNEEPILENDFTALQKKYKSSPNIIDLIEVGDYVNGDRVIEVDLDKKILAFRNYDYYISYKEISRVVTKEQFEEMEYKI